MCVLAHVALHAAASTCRHTAEGMRRVCARAVRHSLRLGALARKDLEHVAAHALEDAVVEDDAVAHGRKHGVLVARHVGKARLVVAGERRPGLQQQRGEWER